MRQITKLAACGTAIGLAWACTTPTEMCACPPLRASVAVVGTLRDAQGTPVANKSFAFEATSDAIPAFTFIAAGASTDATGAFAVRAYSALSGTHTVVARIIGPAQSDTVRISVGSAVFKSERETPDTLRAALRLP